MREDGCGAAMIPSLAAALEKRGEVRRIEWTIAIIRGYYQQATYYIGTQGYFLGELHIRLVPAKWMLRVL